MSRTPTTTTLLHQLQDVVRRMETIEPLVREIEGDVEELKAYNREIEYAKKVLKEYQAANPPSDDSKSYGKALAALVAAITALTAVIVALNK